MATSAEIAQQISDQQSWFMQQNAMAAQVGVNPTAFGGGLGGWNMGGMAPAMPPHPGMASMPGAFNYGAGNFGPGAGNRAGAFATSALSMAPTALMTGMQAHSMLYGSGMSPLSNPVGAYMLARGAGFGIGASMGVAGVASMPMMAVGHAVGSMVGGAQQQSMMNTAVGNYSFANPMSMTGQGFSRGDAAAIGQQVRQLAMVPELLTSFQEISRILPQLKNMGVMQGVRDAAEFNRRMKDAIVTIRDVSRIIGSSLEEAGEFFAHSRRVGFFGREDQIRNAMNARVTQSLTGMDSQQFMQMQQQGAAFGTAVGGSRLLGAQGVTAISNRLGALVMNSPGMQQTLENITGQSGTDALTGAAGMMQNLGQRVAGTAPGRFMMAGFMKVGANGEVELDRDLMQRQQRGEVSMDEIRRRGMQNMGNRRFVEKFERRQTRLAQQFTAEGGPESLLALLRGAGIDEDAAGYMLQSQFGATEQQADLAEALFKDQRSGLGDQRRLVASVVQRQAARREQGPGGLMKRLGTTLSNKITQPFAQASAEMHRRVGQWVDEIVEDIGGEFIVQATEQGKKDFIEALSSQNSKDAARRAFGVSGQGMAGTHSRRSITGSVRHWLGTTELGAWVESAGTDFKTTGFSEDEQARRYGRQLGLGANATREQIEASFRGMAMGPLSGVEQGGVNEARRVIENLALNDEEYMRADPRRRLELAEAALTKAGPDYGWGALSKGMRSMRDRGTSGVSPARMMALATGEFKPEDLAATSTVVDPEKVHTQFREAQDNMRKVFGAQAAAGLMVGGRAGDLMDLFYGEKNPEKAKHLRRAIQDGDMAAVKVLTGQNFTKDELDAVGQGLRKTGASAEGRAAWEDFKQASHDENRSAIGRSLKQVAEDSKALAEVLPNSISNQVAAFGAAAQTLGTGLETGTDKNADWDAVKNATSAVTAALDAIKDPREREKVLASLPTSLRVAVSRQHATKRNLKDLVGKEGLTVAKLKDVTGLSEKEIGEVLGKQVKLSDIVPLDKAMAAELATKSERSGVAAGLLAGGEAMKQQIKDNSQTILLRTMTETLVAIAEKQGVDVKQQRGALKQVQESGAGALPGGGKN